MKNPEDFNLNPKINLNEKIVKETEEKASSILGSEVNRLEEINKKISKIVNAITDLENNESDFSNFQNIKEMDQLMEKRNQLENEKKLLIRNN